MHVSRYFWRANTLSFCTGMFSILAYCILHSQAQIHLFYRLASGHLLSDTLFLTSAVRALHTPHYPSFGNIFMIYGASEPLWVFNTGRDDVYNVVLRLEVRQTATTQCWDGTRVTIRTQQWAHVHKRPKDWVKAASRKHKGPNPLLPCLCSRVVLLFTA